MKWGLNVSTRTYAVLKRHPQFRALFTICAFFMSFQSQAIEFGRNNKKKWSDKKQKPTTKTTTTTMTTTVKEGKKADNFAEKYSSRKKRFD